MFWSLYDEVTNVLGVSVLSHDRYQYHNLILSKQTWAYARQHLQHLSWCQWRWRGADVSKECLETNFHLSSMLLRKLCVHYANGFDKLKVSISFIVTLYIVIRCTEPWTYVTTWNVIRPQIFPSDPAFCTHCFSLEYTEWEVFLKKSKEQCNQYLELLVVATVCHVLFFIGIIAFGSTGQNETKCSQISMSRRSFFGRPIHRIGNFLSNRSRT
jgi:hypothetical protein